MDYLGSGKYLHNAINKYGKQNFIKQILSICKDKQELDEMEIFWIKYFRLLDLKVYNIVEGGEGRIKGYKHTLDEKIKIGLNGKNRKWMNNGINSIMVKPEQVEQKLKEGYILGMLEISNNKKKSFSMSEERKREYKIKFSGKGNPMYGKKQTEESKRKNSETQKRNGKTKGDKNPAKRPEVRQKISINGKGKHNHKGKNNPMYGHIYTEETLQKMRKPRSEETKQKMRKPKPEGFGEKISIRMFSNNPMRNMESRNKIKNKIKERGGMGKEKNPNYGNHKLKGIKKSIIFKDKMKKIMLGKNKGKKYLNNGVKEIKVKLEQIEQKLSEGFILGRLRGRVKEFSPCAKTFIFYSPCGIKHIVKGNFINFCKEQGLSGSSIYYSMKKNKSYNGWKVKKV